MTIDGHVDFEYNNNGVMWLFESNLTTFGEVSFSNNEFKKIPQVASGDTIESYISPTSLFRDKQTLSTTQLLMS